MTSTWPLMELAHATMSILGTNPIAGGVFSGDDHFLLDTATTAVAFGEIEIQRRKEKEKAENFKMLMVGKPLTNVFNGMTKIVKIQKICGLCDYIPLAAHCSPATKKTSSSKKLGFFQNGT
uniref:Uncharacterized protein n=1 Tax=Glossina pallidipes TaxID=7398 RepID=A0A1B0ABB3_GLOPL